MTFLDTIYYENSLKAWLVAALITFLSIFILRVLRETVTHRMSVLSKKTKSNLDDIAVKLFEKTNSLFMLFVSMYIGSLVLTLPESINKLVISIAVIALLIQAAIWGSSFISLWGADYLKRKVEKGSANETTISALTFVAKLILWSITVLIVLDNLGIDVTALVAGLGVGGIAVALAVQNVLGDLFASLAIVLDKPFVIGDFIIVGDYMGCVERIGLKTIHIRSLSGEQIVFSNTDLLQSRIRNYKRMNERRIVFNVGVTYETEKAKVAGIPEMIKEAVEKQKSARFDRSHFKAYGDFALIYETVYYVLSPDYNIYMDIQQAINLDIFNRFNDEGIEFAYPTQKLYITREADSV